MSIIYFKSRVIPKNIKEKNDFQELPQKSINKNYNQSISDLYQHFPKQSERLISSSHIPYDLKGSKSMTTFNIPSKYQVQTKSVIHSSNKQDEFGSNDISRKYSGNIDEMLKRYNITKVDEDCITTCNSIKDKSTKNTKLINQQDYLSQSQKHINQKLKTTLIKLQQSEQRNSQLQIEKKALEEQLSKIRSELDISNAKARWYQKYAQDKDFQAKAVYWKTYFQQLSQTEKNCEDHRKNFKF